MYGLLFQLPYLFAQRFGEDTGRTGRTMLAMMAMMVIGTPLGGRSSEQLGARMTSVAGIAVLGGVLARGGATATLEHHRAAMAVFGGALAVSAFAALALAGRDTAGREPAAR